MSMSNSKRNNRRSNAKGSTKATTGAPGTETKVAAPVVAEQAAAPVAAPQAVLPEVPAPVGTGTGAGLKIEKDREERNGIKRPSIGGKCRAVWDACDAFAETNGDDPTAKDVKDMAAANGWNPNNASIEFYQWRKFNGITGRKPKAPAAPAQEQQAS
jgi:hypothetical protein